MSKYLLRVNAKFCTSDHCMQIETGRYKNIPRQQRLCNICKVVKDECHFLLNLLDFSLLYKNDFDLSEYDESFSLNLFLYFSVATFLNCI
jgi:hypothetical protein